MGPVDTSNELLNIDCDKFIAEGAEAASGSGTEQVTQTQCPAGKKSEASPYEKGEQMIQDAESARRRMTNTTGMFANKQPDFNPQLNMINCDEEYMVIGAHVDSALQEKVINFEYVDFVKLILKDRITKIEDHRFELVVRGGSTFFAPVSDREALTISNFSHWEQAFRIFSNILIRVYPAKPLELIQYNHTIYIAALTFMWDNVYQYDKEFRMHISKFPQRSWAVILQQAWSMCHKDRVCNHEDTQRGGGVAAGNRDGKKEMYKCFNRGKCTFGASCCYDHRCAVKRCGKFGHGTHICRLRSTGGESSTSSPKPVETAATKNLLPVTLNLITL